MENEIDNEQDVIAMTEAALRKWEPLAWAVKERPEKLPLPYPVLGGEALDVARFCSRYWEPVRDPSGQPVNPGLRSAVNRTFTANIGQELRELHMALHSAQARYCVVVDGPGTAPVDRAHFVISEIRAALEWLFNDGVEDASDAQLAKVVATHEDAFSQDALAAALFDFATLARLHREELHGLGGFDVALVDEAPRLALRLQEHSAGPEKIASLPATTALDLRNRIGVMLYQRMQQVRAAARFVFRGHPSLIREVTSAYGRHQRAAHRQQAAVTTTTGASEAVTAGE